MPCGRRSGGAPARMAEVEVPSPEELHERRETTFSRRVALTTAIYAIALSIGALGGNNAVKEMLLAQQQSSDQWAFYQAKVIREHQYRGQQMTQLAEPSTVKGAEREKLAALAGKFAEEEKRYAVSTSRQMFWFSLGLAALGAVLTANGYTHLFTLHLRHHH